MTSPLSCGRLNSISRKLSQERYNLLPWLVDTSDIRWAKAVEEAVRLPTLQDDAECFDELDVE